MKSFYFFVISVTFAFLFVFPSYSIVCAQLFEPNNKFGIHLATPSDDEINSAADLNNSSQGDWSYVTLVLQDTDYDAKKWQEVFDKLRVKRLIPIIRLATHIENSVWVRPKEKDVLIFLSFAQNLNWPVKQKYIVLFNEPNHGSEWGGECDPESYADIAYAFASALKKADKDYFIMLSGFDQASPHKPPDYCSEDYFLKIVFSRQSALAEYIDGIASHSYPNPGFSASPLKRGRGSISGYRWERDLYRKYTQKELPVFITETGWVNTIQEDILAEYYSYAYLKVWLPDNFVRAVTPFILTYIGEPFEKFSWQKPDNKEYYKHYNVIKSLEKEKGNPPQVHKAYVFGQLPTIFIQGSLYEVSLTLQNIGQSIWHKPDGYEIRPIEPSFSDVKFSNVYFFKPKSFIVENMTLNLLNTESGKKQLSAGLYKDDILVSRLFSWDFEVAPYSRIVLRANILPFLPYRGSADIIVYDKRGRKIFEQKDTQFINGKAEVSKFTGVAIGQSYVISFSKDNRILQKKEFIAERENYIVFDSLFF